METYKTNFDDGNNKGQELVRKAKAAFSDHERSNVETLWQELAEFILPVQNRKFFGSQTRGTKNDHRIFDITGPTACRDLAAAMHSTITNPATRWSKLRFRETQLNNLDAAMSWTSNAAKEIHNALSDSNFDTQVGACYQSLTGLGTCVLLHEEVEDNGLFQGMNFVAVHLSEVAYCENKFGMVDTLYRKFELTLKQAYEKFGDAIGDLKDRVAFAPQERVEFYQCIYPRDPKDVKLGPTGQAAPKDRPIASCYVMAKGNKLVLESGYYEFPAYCVRWLTLPGEVYGYGPGHIARADVMTLNTVRREILKGLAKAVNPVLFTNQNNILTGDMRPGKIVSVRDINGMREGVTQSRFDISFLVADQLTNAVKSAFYIDKLMLPPRTETGEMTAYEIQQRLEQMQVILGPPLSRLNTELLQPLVMRTLNILMRAGRIPAIPKEVIEASQNETIGGYKSIDLDIAFVNSLARSQQLAELRNISAWVQEVGTMAQIKPEALDRINGDAVAETMARIRDIDEDLIVSDDDVKAMRDERAKQAQAQMLLQGGEQMSNIAKNMGQTKGGM